MWKKKPTLLQLFKVGTCFSINTFKTNFHTDMSKLLLVRKIILLFAFYYIMGRFIGEMYNG